jgi:hypothetical protein
VAGAGRYERLLAARRRGSKPAQTLAPASFAGSSALALAAAGSWPPDDPSLGEPDLVREIEAPASVEPLRQRLPDPRPPNLLLLRGIKEAPLLLVRCLRCVGLEGGAGQGV